MDAGRPALDLVNAAPFADGDAVVAWLVRARLLGGPAPAPDGLLAEARALRDAIDACVVAVVEGREPDAAAVAVVDEWLAFAGARPQLVLAADGAPRLTERPPADSPRRALGMVALDAARLLGRSEERERIRICEADDCSTRFFDRSPAARRRWCSMSRCGNVAKARRHRARARERAA